MNWKMKAVIQRACAAMPVFREEIYWLVQTRLGLRPVPYDAEVLLKDAAAMAIELRAQGFDLCGARVMEVGTGRSLDMPIALWLLGAESTITIDLHPYLKPGRVAELLAFVREHRGWLREIFLPACEAAGLDHRLNAVCAVRTCAELMQVARITVMAPADAARTGLPAGSIDLHVSYTVLEHIPPAILREILREAARLLSPRGLAIHHIDLSDHFRRDDGSITAINFLRYPARKWDRIAGNQYSYQNRMREPDYRTLYADAGHEPLAWRVWRDERSRAALETGFPLDPDFRRYTPDELITVLIRAISRTAGTC